MIALIRALGAMTHGFLAEFGRFCLFTRTVIRTAARTRGNLRPVIEQIGHVSYRSLPTVAFAGVFVGAILVLQFNEMLKEYDAGIFLGGLNTSSVVREVGPLIISFLLAGKIGAFIAAELGTMRVTEQIDAVECLGTNPIQFLIVPRFAGIVVSSMLLLALGLMISVAGSMTVATLVCGLNPLQYLSSVPKFTGVSTLVAGMIKSAVYGTIVASVSCFYGFNATGGARGVGRAVTQAAIYTNLYILIANFVLSNLLDRLGGLFK
ncbi:MAG: ABC transporter permease [Oligoflexia bacterium]|nr:ABC transporter permease [Oligoflexia bacterium]